MIVGIFHQGSGLGNQLARLIATRVRAADLGVDWGMMYNHDNSGKEKGFKGKSFMDIGNWDKGVKKTVIHFDIAQNTNLPSEPEVEFGFWQEKCVRDEISWEHREKEVDEWLKVEPLEMPDDLCVIGFRGGEFSVYPDLFLTKEYWDEA